MKSIISTVVLALVSGMFPTTATAQAQSTTPDPKPTDTSWAYVITNASHQNAFDGERINIGTAAARFKGLANYRHSSFEFEFNFVTGKPHVADVGYKLGNIFRIDVGIIGTFAADDHPGPWSAMFPSSPEIAVIRQLTDPGLKAEMKRGSFRLQIASFAGEGSMNPNTDNAINVGARAEYSSGPVKIALSSQRETPRGVMDYTTANVTVNDPAARFSLAVGHRSDLNQTGGHLQIELPLNRWRVGAQYERMESSGGIVVNGATFVIQRSFGWMDRCRIGLLQHVSESGSPQTELRFQQAVNILG